MGYKLLAELVVVLHIAFILFVVAGGLLALWWRRAPWLHLPAAVWGVFIEFSGWTCPLTPVENWLRHQAGEAGYEGDFVEHYLLPVLYLPGYAPEFTRELQLTAGILVLVANAAIYGWLLLRRRSRMAEAGPVER